MDSVLMIFVLGNELNRIRCCACANLIETYFVIAELTIDVENGERCGIIFCGEIQDGSS
jgi:hypothetical protein